MSVAASRCYKVLCVKALNVCLYLWGSSPLTNRKPVYITGSTGFPVQWCELLCRCIISEGLLLTHLLMEKFLFYHRTFPLAVTVHTEGEYLGVYFTMEGECADSPRAWHGNADEPFSRLQTAASISDFILISRSQDAAHSSPSSRLAAMTLTKTHFKLCELPPL